MASKKIQKQVNRIVSYKITEGMPRIEPPKSKEVGLVNHVGVFVTSIEEILKNTDPSKWVVIKKGCSIGPTWID